MYDRNNFLAIYFYKYYYLLFDKSPGNVEPRVFKQDPGLKMEAWEPEEAFAQSPKRKIAGQ